MPQTILIDISESNTNSTSFTMGPGYKGGVIVLPAITSATITLQVSVDNSTFVDLYDIDGNIVQLDAGTAARAFIIPPEACSMPYGRVVSSAGQAADRTITVWLLPNV